MNAVFSGDMDPTERVFVLLLSVMSILACNEGQRAVMRGADAFRVPTTNMEPTIRRGEMVLGDPLPPSSSISRGTIVVYQSPSDPAVKWIKRVIGLPGETLEVRAKEIIVDGETLTEPFVAHSDPEIIAPNPSLPEPFRSRDHFGPVTLGPEEYFLMGDNRDDSYDSRWHGPIRREQIEAEVHLIQDHSGAFRPPEVVR